MSISAIILGSILIALSIYMVTKALKKMTVLKAKENENRSADGVVEFSSVEISRTHSADKGFYTVMGVFGFFLGIFGVALLIAGFDMGYLGF